jgi:hypothetical protein
MSANRRMKYLATSRDEQKPTDELTNGGMTTE